jgi:lipopolysaccharide assembly outer membrane protein LptD (OstA)
LAGSNEFSDRKELGARASIPLSDQWTMASRIVTDLNTTTGTRLWGTGFTYHDECFSIGLGVERDFISDGENKPGTSFIFRVDLKHLGGELQNDYFTPKRANVYTGSLLPQN